MIKNHEFKSLYELLDFFTDELVCEEYLALTRWGGKPECPYCYSNKVNALNGATKR